MMLRRYRLEVIALFAIVAFIGLFLLTTSFAPDAEFAGADTAGSAQVAALTGRSAEEFTPLVPQWEPPSGEIESALFALQAAGGGLVAGYIFGRWKGEAKKG
ncbi:MAG: cobalt transport protein CbiN [Methanomicrobiales archaeon]|nr:cobalt transport protein CbiN [Methanomicrobiales archaeon]